MHFRRRGEKGLTGRGRGSSGFKGPRGAGLAGGGSSGFNGLRGAGPLGGAAFSPLSSSSSLPPKLCGGGPTPESHQRSNSGLRWMRFLSPGGRRLMSRPGILAEEVARFALATPPASASAPWGGLGSPPAVAGATAPRGGSGAPSAGPAGAAPARGAAAGTPLATISPAGAGASSAGSGAAAAGASSAGAGTAATSDAPRGSPAGASSAAAAAAAAGASGRGAPSCSPAGVLGRAGSSGVEGALAFASGGDFASRAGRWLGWGGGSKAPREAPWLRAVLAATRVAR